MMGLFKNWTGRNNNKERRNNKRSCVHILKVNRVKKIFKMELVCKGKRRDIF